MACWKAGWKCVDEILGDISGGRFRSCETEQAPSQGSELLGPAWKSSGMEKFRVFSPGGKGIPIPALRSFGGCRFRGAGGFCPGFPHESSAWGWVEPAGQIFFLVHCAYIKISSWEEFLEPLLFHCLLFACLTDSKYFCQKNLPFLARTSKFVSLVASWNVSGCVLIVNVCLLLVGLMKCLLNSRNFPDEACHLIWFYWRCSVLVQAQRACILSVTELPKMPGRIVLRGRRLKHTF